MFRYMLSSGLLFVLAVGITPAQAGCPGCDEVAKKGEGFHCSKGLIYGLSMESQDLYTAIAGKEVDVSKMQCPGCKIAAAQNGKCSHCNVSIANGKLYRSAASHMLAKAAPVNAEQAAHCPSCKTAFEGNGFCTSCDAGYVAGRMFKGRESYEAAKSAHVTLASAVDMAKKCASCAVAIVTDGTCPKCNVSYKEGKKTTG